MMIDNKVDIQKLIHIQSKHDFFQEKRKTYLEILNNDPEIEKLIQLELEQQKKQQQNKMEIENEIPEKKDEDEDENEDEDQDENEDEDEDENEEEEEEEEHYTQGSKTSSVIQTISKTSNQIKDDIISKNLKQKLEGDLDIPQLLHNNMKSGQYSYFSQAIKQGWQGVTYLLISDGYEFFRAIEDAIAADQFQLVLTLLMKVKYESEVQRVNQFGQNLFHLLAKNARNISLDLKQEIVEELEIKNISPFHQDTQGKLPLHYAVEQRDSFLMEYFLNTLHLIQ